MFPLFLRHCENKFMVRIATFLGDLFSEVLSAGTPGQETLALDNRAFDERCMRPLVVQHCDS